MARTLKRWETVNCFAGDAEKVLIKNHIKHVSEESMSLEDDISKHIHTCSFCRNGGVGCPEVLKFMEQADKYEPLLGHLKKFEMTPDEKERLKVELAREPVYGPMPVNPLEALKSRINDLERRVKELESVTKIIRRMKITPYGIQITRKTKI
jgi:hypothetical protein